MARILVIDDDPFVRSMVERTLRTFGHRVRVVEDGEQGLEVLARCDVDLVVTDILMPGKEGIETIVDIRSWHGPVPILAISGGGATSAPEGPLEDARLIGADATLAKPFDVPTLIGAVDRLLETVAA